MSTLSLSLQEAPDNKRMPPTINILNAVAFVANVFVLYGLRLFGIHINAEVPASFPTLITPASWTRLVWPLILILQFGWVIIQLMPKYRSNVLVTVVGKKYLGICLAQIAWSLFFSFQILSLSFVAIIVMLVLVFLIFREQSMIETTASASLKVYAMYKLVFSMLLGWIVVATFVDINVLLVAMGVSTTMQFYVALVSLTGMLTAAGSVFDLAVILVIAWALIGIFFELKNPDYLINLIFQESYVSTIRVWALVSFFICFVIGAWRGYSLWRSHSTAKEEDSSSIGGVGDTATTTAADVEGGNYTTMT